MADNTAPLHPAFPFMRLPLELREQVYSHYFDAGDHLVQNPVLEAKGFYGGVYQWDLDVFYVNKQIYRESKRVWKRENIFVKIATPWPSAGMYHVYLNATDGVPEHGAEFSLSGGSGHLNHISSEGLVPIVCAERKAEACNEHHAVVQIDAPLQGIEPEHMVVMLVDDLPLFARTWYYSALSYPMLNERLRATFILRNPMKEKESSEHNNGVANGEGAEKEEGLGVPISLQKKLLLPFEHVKGLAGISIHGFSNSVRSELARLQALPIPSLHESLETAANLMAAGNVAIANPDKPASEAALDALDLYKKAFHAIHILIYDRTRRVMADVFFHNTITQGRFAGQSGITVRVILRLQLVACTIGAYNQLARWDEAAFWGMRSINIFSDNFSPSFEAFLEQVHEGSDLGKIYMRTGIALWHMERAPEAWFGELISYADDPMADSDKLWSMAARFGKSEARRKDTIAELKAYNIPQEKIEAVFGVGRPRGDGQEGQSKSTDEEEEV